MRYLVLLALAAVVSGCASIGADTRSAIDFNKVWQVENAARAVGVQVYWVNYPTKNTASVN